MSLSNRSPRSDDLPLELYWQEIKDFEPLARDEETRLFRAARRGDEDALRRFVEANLRFVFHVANQVWRAGDPPMSELVAEGNVGLMTAVRRFDETRGFKFITYAVWWIRQAMFEATARGRYCARVPMNRIDDMRKLQRQTDRLGQELGRTPTFDEVVDSVDFEPERALAAHQTAGADVSLDAPVHDDSEEPLLASLRSGQQTEASFDDGDLRERLQRCLQLLDDRERYIICAYFGIAREEARTLEQIGLEINLTRERVRQLRNRAIDKLRESCSQILVDWSEN